MRRTFVSRFCVYQIRRSHIGNIWHKSVEGTRDGTLSCRIVSGARETYARRTLEVGGLLQACAARTFISANLRCTIIKNLIQCMVLYNFNSLSPSMNKYFHTYRYICSMITNPWSDFCNKCMLVNYLHLFHCPLVSIGTADAQGIYCANADKDPDV